MRLLLDTHTLLWFLEDDHRLSVKARSSIEDGNNAIFVSSASLWEIAIKISLGKLSISGPVETFLSNSRRMESKHSASPCCKSQL